MKKLLCILLLLAGSAGAWEDSLLFYDNRPNVIRDSGMFIDTYMWEYFALYNMGRATTLIVRKDAGRQATMLINFPGVFDSIEARMGGPVILDSVEYVCQSKYTPTATDTLAIRRSLKPWVGGFEGYSEPTLSPGCTWNSWKKLVGVYDSTWSYAGLLRDCSAPYEVENRCSGGLCEDSCGDVSSGTYADTGYAVYNEFGDGVYWYHFDVTLPFQNWYSGTWSQYGLQIYAINTDQAYTLYTYACNYYVSLQRPRLIVYCSSSTPAPEPTGNVKGVTLRGVTLDSP